MLGVTTIVVSGPQATGKTTLALAVGRMVGAPVFSRDPLMAVLFESRPRWPRMRPGWMPETGFKLQTALLARQLELGQSTVLECVATPAIRRHWREMTLEGGYRFVSVECICTDVAVHRARFEQRRHRPPQGVFTWEYVASTMRRYEPDEHADVVADAMRSVGDLAAEIVAVVRPNDDSPS